MPITSRPFLLQPAFNEVQVKTENQSELTVAYQDVNGTWKSVVLSRESMNFNLSGILGCIFHDGVQYINTLNGKQWIRLNSRLLKAYRIEGNTDLFVINGVQHKGETLNLLNFGGNAILTERSVKDGVLRIPKYKGYPVGVVGMNKWRYNEHAQAEIKADRGWVSPGVPVGVRISSNVNWYIEAISGVSVSQYEGGDGDTYVMVSIRDRNVHRNLFVLRASNGQVLAELYLVVRNDPYIELDKHDITVPDDITPISFSIKSNVGWIVQGDEYAEQLYSFNPISSSGNASVTMTPKRLPDPYSGTVKVYVKSSVEGMETVYGTLVIHIE